jgi:hypothetical protein
MSDCEHKWRLMRVPYECPYCLRERAERAERAEAEIDGWRRNADYYRAERDAHAADAHDLNVKLGESRKWHEGAREVARMLTERAERAEAERDELRGLLAQAREALAHHQAMTRPFDSTIAMLDFLDAKLREGKG